MASVTAFFADADPSAREYRARLDMVNQYMRHAQLPGAIREKIRTYYELRYPGGRAFDEGRIMSELSSPLTQEVRMHKCQQVLSALNILDNDKTLAFELCENLTRVVFVTGDFIIRQQEVSDGMYFISSGSVEIVATPEGGKREEVITTLGAHSFFGEMALLNPAGKATASVRVITYFEGYMLSFTDYSKLVQNHPSLHDYMQAAAKLRLRTRQDLSEERDADLTTLFAMLDPTKRKLIKLERESREKAQGAARRLSVRALPPGAGTLPDASVSVVEDRRSASPAASRGDFGEGVTAAVKSLLGGGRSNRKPSNGKDSATPQHETSLFGS